MSVATPSFPLSPITVAEEQQEGTGTTAVLQNDLLMSDAEEEEEEEEAPPVTPDMGSGGNDHDDNDDVGSLLDTTSVEPSSYSAMDFSMLSQCKLILFSQIISRIIQKLKCML